MVCEVSLNFKNDLSGWALTYNLCHCVPSTLPSSPIPTSVPTLGSSYVTSSLTGTHMNTPAHMSWL